MINAAIVDSGIFIGTKYKSDQWHSKAVLILNSFAEGKIKEVYITNYVLLETVNFLLRKTDFNTALEAYNYLENADRIKVINVDNLRGIRIRDLFEKYKTLSLTDCSLVSVAEDFNIKYLFSFDRAFDKIKGIKRLEGFEGLGD